MGLFGGKNEEELRATGTPTSARVTYVDDTGKRRNGGGEARIKVRVQIEEGSARGRELEKTKWVPVIAMPRLADRLSIRIDTDDPDDWAWGDIRMYQPNVGQATMAPAPAPTYSTAPPPPAPVQGQVLPPGQPVPTNHPIAKMFGMEAAFQLADLPKMIQQAMAQGNVTMMQSGQPMVVDARNMPQLRAQILSSLKQYGVDVEAMQASGQIPAPPPMPASSPVTGASPSDITGRLKRLDELRAQGLLTEEEHREQRQRIIDEI
jgi:hypothetical protein